MTAEALYRQRPDMVLREELDEWALLFNPDTGDVVGVNRMGVTIWRMLEEPSTLPAILRALRDLCEEFPREAETEVADYLKDLSERGFVTSNAGHA